jgi:hypothetical protein
MQESQRARRIATVPIAGGPQVVLSTLVCEYELPGSKSFLVSLKVTPKREAAET